MEIQQLGNVEKWKVSDSLVFQIEKFFLKND